MKRDPADIAFSQYIRLRDTKCQRCGSLVRINLETGMPVSHHNSHFWSRGKESTRFDESNCDTLCYGCHHIWEKDERKIYEAFKIKQLGQNEFNKLDFRAHHTVKKDRKMALIVAKELLKDIQKETWG